MKKNQKTRILEYIKKFGSITSWDAYSDLGITQLGARIDGLKKDGYIFRTSLEHSINRYNEKVSYKRYFLESEPI